MEDGRRSGDPSVYVAKNRGASGCLIVRKKGGHVVGGHGGSGSRKVFDSKKQKKMHRLEFSDSGSGDELLVPPRRRLGSETIRVCNGLSVYDKGVVEESGDVGRKRSREEDVRRNDVGMIGRNGEDLTGRKRNKLDVFEFDEYDGIDGPMMMRKHFDDGGLEARRFLGSVMRGRSGSESEYEIGTSRHDGFDRRKSMYYDKASGRHHGKRDGSWVPISFLRDQYDSDEPIRFQGKNGVLKVMVKKKKMDGGSLINYKHLEPKESRRGQRAEDPVKRNAPILHSLYSESKSVGKASPIAATSLSKNGKVSDQDSEDSHTLLKLESKNSEARSSLKTPVNKNRKIPDMDSEDSDTSLKLGQKKVEVCKSVKRTSSSGEKTPCNKLPPSAMKEAKVKRGTGTEKQKLRERVREMLQKAGWHIDYRPRRNRDYLDAVYINPSGTAYWSIIKAYDALIKQLNEEEIKEKSMADGSPFTPLSDEVLSQLTRKTRKKMEKEKKKKQKDESESDYAGETTVRKSSSTRPDEESMDSGEEKLSSFIKQGAKTLRSKLTGDGSVSGNSKGQSSTHGLDVSTEEPSDRSSTHQGRKSRKLGRCTLQVRSSNEGLNSDGDGFVPYSGKRTILSWLTDSETVELSQKVHYMNRRRTKVMLEGWVTKDGIHCGCCSKILTVSKFEIHAGSKLRQPFQNIYLDSGVSLLECQIEAWNKQESAEQIGFHSVHIDGDDPNDDTCGICGDGGDLICCDTCPSTFHQSCLHIEMLPLGDWHCPNCTCKFCGLASETSSQENDTAVSALPTCRFCSRKYHNSCIKEMDAPTDANCSVVCFCGKKCSELFEQLQRYLGVKHELEAGFSWSLVHRTDVVSDPCLQALPQRVECNSKLAVALSVMDECFLPIIDRRSGINIIKNVLYNCGSNFNRLNYSGFYAVILERGDELISAASIRFHGTQLAEMPFIGTRHMYRRQGMCHRLFGAIELVLSTLKIEKLIIPAISELTHTWTEVFGFTTLDDTLKQELKSLNILVFPGIDMLQKQLLEEKTDGKRTSNTNEAKLLESEASQCNIAEVANKSDTDSSDRCQIPECDNGGPERGSETNDEAATTNSNSKSRGLEVTLNDTSMLGSVFDASHELKRSASLEPAINTDSESRDKTDETALDDKSPGNFDSRHDKHDISQKVNSDSPMEENTQSNVGDLAVEDSPSPYPGVTSDDFSVGSPVSTSDKVTQPGFEERISNSNVSHSLETKPELSCPAADITESCEGGDLGDSHVGNVHSPCPEAGPSLDETNTGNSLEDINETPGVSVCRSNDANDCSKQVNSEVDEGIVCNGRSEMHAGLEVVQEAKHGEGSVLKALEDGCETAMTVEANYHAVDPTA